MAESSKKNKNSVATITVTALAIIIILVLGFLFYYFSVKSISLAGIETASISGSVNNVVVKTPPTEFTNVMHFTPSEVLPKETKNGNCQSSSVAEPYREDAFRCMVDNDIYDPCFLTSQDGFVFCQVNPLAPEAFLIKLSKPLPEPFLPEVMQENWGWFVKLKDGNYCSPFTGTRPFLGTGYDEEVAYYGCKSTDKDQQVVLIGDLTKGNVWTANEAILIQQSDKSWTINLIQQVDIDTVWQ
jgi:hypothetical protein